MAVTVSYSKSEKPGCVSVMLKNGTSESQILIDEINRCCVRSAYTNGDAVLKADITVGKLKDALTAANVQTLPPHEKLVEECQSLSSGRRM